jgi:transcriptional regulator with XRE-family HTH domain
VRFLCVGSPNPIIDRTFRAVFELPKDRKRTRNKPPKCYRNPVVMAHEWQNMVSRENCTPADLARKLGVSRARVAQILRLLRLAPDVLQQIAELGNPLPTPAITECILRPIVDLSPNDQREWMARFARRIYGVSPAKVRMTSRV